MYEGEEDDQTYRPAKRDAAMMPAVTSLPAVTRVNHAWQEQLGP